MSELKSMIDRARMLSIMGDISEDGEDHAECVDLLAKLKTMMDADEFEQLLADMGA